MFLLWGGKIFSNNVHMISVVLIYQIILLWPGACREREDCANYFDSRKTQLNLLRTVKAIQYIINCCSYFQLSIYVMVLKVRKDPAHKWELRPLWEEIREDQEHSVLRKSLSYSSSKHRFVCLHRASCLPHKCTKSTKYLREREQCFSFQSFCFVNVYVIVMLVHSAKIKPCIYILHHHWLPRTQIQKWLCLNGVSAYSGRARKTEHAILSA